MTQAQAQVQAQPSKIEEVDLSNLNISQKIRKLHSLGFSRGSIAKFLNKRYQHVRNVIVTPIATKS